MLTLKHSDANNVCDFGLKYYSRLYSAFCPQVSSVIFGHGCLWLYSAPENFHLDLDLKLIQPLQHVKIKNNSRSDHYYRRETFQSFLRSVEI